MSKSMTGYGRAKLRAGGLEIEVELRSVNHRYLQLRQRLPEEFSRFEAEVEEGIRKAVRRGAVTLSATAAREASAPTVRLRLDVARRYLDQLRKLKKAFRLEGEPTLERVASLPGVFESAGEDSRGSEKEVRVLRKAVSQALAALDASRTREGKALEKDLRARRAALLRLCEKIAERAPQLVPEYRDRLRRRIDELLSGASARLGEDDLAREAALFAARSDIAEELTRFRTHLDELGRLLGEKGEVGRRLDFLLQEMNRETNTMGSKASDASIAHLVVEMKNEIERIREQAANLE